MSRHEAQTILSRYRKAKARRGQWEGLWRECVDYTLPQRDGGVAQATPGERKGDRLFDATAGDAAEQLAASLLSELTPPWSRWFGLAPGQSLSDEERRAVGPYLGRVEDVVQGHLDRSNFAVEMHQCYLDLVTLGTASLLFEEAPLGEASAFRFKAVPLQEAVLEEGPDGKLDATFRRSELTAQQLAARFGAEALPHELRERGEEAEDERIAVVEAVLPDGAAYDYVAVLDRASGGGDGGGSDEGVLASGRFGRSPFINFRWMKAPGEVYGRSPVMRALPDIKTANKVVELTLKNASIAVTGIWQADDDGVLNPASVRLTPGTIIPKAVGSSGLTPLQAPGNFDVSALMLGDLRERIRRALMANQLSQVNSPNMTATEVLQRSSELSRLLGATYGRLQAELLTPLVARALGILGRRGEIDSLSLDGRLVELQARSPLAQAQAQRDISNTAAWVERLAAFGEPALAVVNVAETARWIGRRLGVPGSLINEEPVLDELPQQPVAQAVTPESGGGGRV